MPAQRFVFICGLHRSGTSLLHGILGAHPEISAFHDTGAPEDEGQHLQDVYKPARAFGGPGKFCFDPEAYLTEASPLVTEENRKKLLAQWSRYWDMSRPVLAEKSPPNIIRTRFLQAMFPESRFIVLTRHPIPVSFATQKWSKTDIPELVKHWCAAHEAWLDDRPHLKHYLWLRYEDLIAEPESAMERLRAFLDIAAWPLSEPLDRAINEKYFAQWEKYKAANPEQYRMIQSLEKTPRRFGYGFDVPPVSAIDRDLP